MGEGRYSRKRGEDKIMVYAGKVLRMILASMWSLNYMAHKIKSYDQRHGKPLASFEALLCAWPSRAFLEAFPLLPR